LFFCLLCFFYETPYSLCCWTHTAYWSLELLALPGFHQTDGLKGAQMMPRARLQPAATLASRKRLNEVCSPTRMIGLQVLTAGPVGFLNPFPCVK
jgi:hypothetical protein